MVNWYRKAQEQGSGDDMLGEAMLDALDLRRFMPQDKKKEWARALCFKAAVAISDTIPGVEAVVNRDGIILECEVGRITLAVKDIEYFREDKAV